MTADGPGSNELHGDPGLGGPSDAISNARTLQELAATGTLSIEGFDVHARTRTGGRGELGGDWYDVVDVDGGIVVVVGDVAGHGADAASSMLRLRHAALAYLFEDHSPGAVLTRIGRFASSTLPGEVTTAVVAWLPSRRDNLVVASAGHLPPLLLGNGRADFLSPPRGPALGLLAHDYAEAEQPFDPGAALLLYTDGLVERRGETIDDGLQRLAQTALESTDDAALCDRIVTILPDDPGSDDLTLVMVRRDEEA